MSSATHNNTSSSKLNVPSPSPSASALLLPGGRTSPLLARQRVLPIDMHAQLMPFKKGTKSTVPDYAPPEIASFKTRRRDPTDAAAGGGGMWHSSKSISWSTKSAAVAQKIAEASRQREERRLTRQQQQDEQEQEQFADDGDDNHHHHHHQVALSPPAKSSSRSSVAGASSSPSSPPKLSGTAAPAAAVPPKRGGSSRCVLVYGATADGSDVVEGAQHNDEVPDPADIALARARRKLQAAPTSMKRPLSASLSSSRPTSSAPTRTIGDEQQQRQHQQQQQHNELAQADLMDANWRLASVTAPTFSSTGRGREPYPHQDVFGNPYRDDDSVAVEHTEPHNDAFSYHGPYVHNQKQGVGRFTIGGDGSSYVGEFEHGEMSGEGTRYLADGTVMQGTFANGELSGAECIVLCPDGERYEGAFKDGKRHGHGELRWQTFGNSSSNNNSTVMVEEEAFHRFEGEFVADEPCGVGVQTTTKTQRTVKNDGSFGDDDDDAATAMVVVDNIEGNFRSTGPHGHCTRTVTKTKHNAPINIIGSDSDGTQQQHVNDQQQIAAAAMPKKRRVKTVEKFEGDYVDGKEHGQSCAFLSGTTGVEYCGPMQDGLRARVPNTLVLEGVRVVPLEADPKNKKHQQQQQPTSPGGGGGGEQQHAGSSSSPTAVPTSTGSGRKHQPINQDNASWMQPLVAITGQEVIQLRVGEAFLNGFVRGDEDASPVERRFPTTTTTSSSFQPSEAQRDETGRKIQVRVFAADAKNGIASGLRNVFRSMGLEALFQKNIAQSIKMATSDPSSDGATANLEFDVAAAAISSASKGSGRGGGGTKTKTTATTSMAAAAAAGKQGGGGGPAALLSARAAAGGGPAAGAGLLSFHLRTLVVSTVEGGQGGGGHHHRKQQQYLDSLLPPKDSGHHHQQQQQQQEELGGCTREPLLIVASNRIANTNGQYQDHTAELLDIAEDLLVTSAGGGGTTATTATSVNAAAVNAAIFDDINKEINPPPLSPSSVGSHSPGGGGGGGRSPGGSRQRSGSRAGSSSVPPFLTKQDQSQQQTTAEAAAAANKEQQPPASFRNHIGIASQNRFVQAETAVMTKGQATVTVQLAPHQTSSGDLLFIVVEFCDDRVLLNPGDSEATSTFVMPLVVPLLVGANKTPRGKK